MPGIAEQILEYDCRGDKERDPREVLSAKDLAIFKWTALGKSNQEVAQELGITAKSVANRTLDIRHKLGIRLTRFEWIARKYGLLKLEL
jgi:DNA-binding CsgD family transcriptional regulator